MSHASQWPVTYWHNYPTLLIFNLNYNLDGIGTLISPMACMLKPEQQTWQRRRLFFFCNGVNLSTSWRFLIWAPLKGAQMCSKPDFTPKTTWALTQNVSVLKLQPEHWDLPVSCFPMCQTMSLKLIGCFAEAASELLNSLPLQIRSSPTPECFKWLLKAWRSLLFGLPLKLRMFHPTDCTTVFTISYNVVEFYYFHLKSWLFSYSMLLPFRSIKQFDQPWLCYLNKTGIDNEIAKKK